MRMVEICIEKMARININKPQYTLVEILEDVCYAMGQPIEKVTSRDRHKEYATCRQIYSYVSRMYTMEPLSKIRKAVGYDDHTTVVSNVKKLRGYLRVGDPVFRDKWDLYTENSKIYKNISK